MAGFNCFEGALDDAICNSTQLEVLSAPGLISGDACRSYIWKDSAIFPAFTVRYMDGLFPQCIVQMPNIKNVILSGNGLLGKIPAEGIAPSLEQLGVSNNRLKGVLHGNLQNGNLSNIDVSVNFLAGTMDAFQTLNPTEQNVSSMVVKTNLNRLSGDLPASLLELEEGNIDVLQGNVFTCNVNIRASIFLWKCEIQ